MNISGRYSELVKHNISVAKNTWVTSSPCFILDRPHEYAIKLIASVALRVKTISLLSAALTKLATFLLAPSYASVAFALMPNEVSKSVKVHLVYKYIGRCTNTKNSNKRWMQAHWPNDNMDRLSTEHSLNYFAHITEKAKIIKFQVITWFYRYIIDNWYRKNAHRRA